MKLKSGLRSTRWSGGVAVAFAAAAALAVAGCGSSSHSSSSGAGSGAASSSSSSSGGGGGASSSSGSTPGVHGKVITVANSAILSGPESAFSGIADGLNAYLNMITNQGGVNGYTFKIDQRDNAYQPAQAVAVARQIAIADKPFAFVTEGDDPTSAVLPLAAQIKATTFVISDADLTAKGGSNWYGVEASFPRQILYMAQYAVKTLHLTKLALGVEQNASSAAEIAEFKKYVPSIGGQASAEISYPDTQTSFSSQASQLKASGAQVVLFGGGDPTTAAIQKADAAIGYHPKYIGFFAAIASQYGQLAGSLGNGTYFENFYQPVTQTSSPAVQKFLKVVGAVNKNSTNLLGELGWEAGALITAGVQKATANGGTLTEDSFHQALNTLGGQTVGVWPSVTYTAAYHAGPTTANMLLFNNATFKPISPFTALPPAQS
jgi:branched-chain amino acid transport system substrate-binding protein